MHWQKGDRRWDIITCMLSTDPGVDLSLAFGTPQADVHWPNNRVWELLLCSMIIVAQQYVCVGE